VTAFTQYARSGPQTERITPPMTGPIIQVRFSIVCSSEVAAGSCSSSTRFGIPA
jgi:hypothetical protein